MATLKLPSVTREYVRVPVTVKGATADQLRALPVNWRFVTDATAQPGTGDPGWLAGSWDPSGTPAVARCLVGPGGTAELADGDYFCWVWVDGATEEPVRMVGKLRIT